MVVEYPRELTKMVCCRLRKPCFFFCCCNENHIDNYLQKGCLNFTKHPLFINALPWSSLSRHAKFGALGFMVLELWTGHADTH